MNCINQVLGAGDKTILWGQICVAIRPHQTDPLQLAGGAGQAVIRNTNRGSPSLGVR